MPTPRRAAESIVEYQIRASREQALEEVRDRLMSLRANAEEIAAIQRAGFLGGAAAIKNAARELLTEMLAEAPPSIDWGAASKGKGLPSGGGELPVQETPKAMPRAGAASSGYAERVEIQADLVRLRAAIHTPSPMTMPLGKARQRLRQLNILGQPPVPASNTQSEGNPGRPQDTKV